MIVVAGDDLRNVNQRFQPGKNIFFGIGREVGFELVVDCQVGGQNHEVFYAFFRVQIGDHRSHQPGFAHAGGNGEANAGKGMFEVFDGRADFPNQAQRFVGGHLFA